MTSIDRSAYPRFARRLSEEELEERYDLTPAERRFLASNARTGSAYLTLAVMLKTRQQLGYFPACSEVPDQVSRACRLRQSNVIGSHHVQDAT